MHKSHIEKNDLRKFGIMMGIFLLALSLIFSIRHKQIILSLPIISLLFFILAVIMPRLLKPVYIVWMKLACILNWINTRIILFIVFYLIITPMALVMKLFGVDLLDRKIEKGKESYWHKKETKQFNPLDYERQF
ncbi:MAG: sxtJ [Candidatus Omnitrophica bacterium]|nr:sxtJ [Candidatus Omnitrophota bacterium]